MSSPPGVDGIVIRRAESADDPMFAEIRPEVFDHPIIPDNLAAHLASRTHFLACALDGRAMVGMVMANLHLHPDKPNELYVDEIGVTPSHRGRGIATLLMAEAVAWGREQGCSSCWLGTEPDNTAAQALYRKWQDDPDDIVMFEFDL